MNIPCDYRWRDRRTGAVRTCPGQALGRYRTVPVLVTRKDLPLPSEMNLCHRCAVACYEHHEISRAVGDATATNLEVVR